MSGRGARVLFFAIMGIACAGGLGFSVPGAATTAPLPMRADASLDRLCQDSPTEEIDYSKYFTRPERDKGITYVFYNNIIDTTDDAQFGYALLYGLEYAFEKAESDDSLAVGLYFTGSKGTIYLIEKKKFLELRGKKLTAETLLKHLWVAKGSLAPDPAVKR